MHSLRLPPDAPPYHPTLMTSPTEKSAATPASSGSGGGTGDAPPRVCIVVSRYNTAVTHAMRDAAVSAYHARFPAADNAFLGIVEAPGAYELTALSAAAIESGAYEGVVALGCVIRGETDHDRYISQAVATGLTTLTLQTGVPVAFGVITANTPEQATARAGGPDGKQSGNKGTEAMDALLDTLDGARHLFESAADDVPADYSLAGNATDKTTNETSTNTPNPANGTTAAPSPAGSS
jgi:6,7-dimethyl-8-ribityllumazine synthase